MQGRYRDITSHRRERRPRLAGLCAGPRSALGPVLNDQGYHVGRVERNLYWVTDGTYQAAFLTTPDGVVLFDDDFLVLVNGWWEKLQFRVPDIDEPRAWRTELDTYDPGRAADPPDLHAGDDLTLGPGSILVLQAAAAGS